VYDAPILKTHDAEDESEDDDDDDDDDDSLLALPFKTENDVEDMSFLTSPFRVLMMMRPTRMLSTFSSLRHRLPISFHRLV
jgi:hypothetical protein